MELIRPRALRLFFSKKAIRFCLSFVFIFSAFASKNSYGQLVCPNNIDSPASCPMPAINTKVIDASTLSSSSPSDFCLQNTEKGCGTFRFTNLPVNPNCPATLCFTPAQGCGNAAGALCVYASAGGGACTLIAVRNKDEATREVCIELSAVSTYEITLCRPGGGPVSINNVKIIPCCTYDVICPNPDGGTYECIADVPKCDESTVTVKTTANCNYFIIVSTKDEGTGCKSSPFKRTCTYKVYDGGESLLKTCTVTSTAVDTKAPVFNSTLKDLTIECGDPIPALPDIKATDNCGGAVQYMAISSVSIGVCPIKEVIERCIIAKDACGNEAKLCQKVTIQDTKPPVFSNVPANVAVCGENNIPKVGTPTANDKCDGAVKVTYEGETKGTTNCSSAYTLTRKWSAKDACGNIASATQVITVEIPPVGGLAYASKTEFCNIYNERVNLWVEGNIGDVLKWQIDEDCNGKWVDIPNSKRNSIWVTPPAPENEDDCCVRYRAIVGCNIACTPVPSDPVRLTVDVPAKGGRVLYNGYSSKTLCPGQCINLELKGYVGRIVVWQMSDAYSPAWMDIPNSQGETSLKVCYPSRTTYYRVLICATCGICGPPYYTAYSSSFKLSPASMCGMWNDPTALTSNNEMTLAKVYPSPAKDKITLQADGLTEGVATIDVLDITGKVVHREKQPVNNGFNEINMTINHLIKGLYILRLTDSKGQNATIKVSKM